MLMGLDIHAASHLRYVRPIPAREEFDRLDEEVNSQGPCLDDVYFVLSPNDPDFEEHLAGMQPGLYEYTDASEQHGFRAGPYSYYKPGGSNSAGSPSGSSREAFGKPRGVSRGGRSWS
jgi:hypothetical protein